MLYPFAIQVQRITAAAKLPTRGSPGAAGWDLYAAEDVVIHTVSTLVSTGIKISGIPPGYYGRIAPRSGMSMKNMHVGAGVIDRDYRGEIKVLLYSADGEEKQITAGTRIAQIIFELAAEVELIEVETLDETERGEGGFGSTGQ